MLSKNSIQEPQRLIAASVGLAIPSKKDSYGYLSEHHSFGQSEEAAGNYAEDLAATMLATTMGIFFDSKQGWDEKKQICETSGMIIKTNNITQSVAGDLSGQWTTVLAAAVFVP